MLKAIAAAAMLAGSFVALGQAEAKGCIKGAIVGGIAGHFAGHGVAGAAAGCAVGHHYANKTRQPSGDDRNTPNPPPTSSQ